MVAVSDAGRSFVCDLAQWNIKLRCGTVVFAFADGTSQEGEWLVHSCLLSGSPPVDFPFLSTPVEAVGKPWWEEKTSRAENGTLKRLWRTGAFAGVGGFTSLLRRLEGSNELLLASRGLVLTGSLPLWRADLTAGERLYFRADDVVRSRDWLVAVAQVAGADAQTLPLVFLPTNGVSRVDCVDASYPVLAEDQPIVGGPTRKPG